MHTIARLASKSPAGLVSHNVTIVSRHLPLGTDDLGKLAINLSLEALHKATQDGRQIAAFQRHFNQCKGCAAHGLFQGNAQFPWRFHLNSMPTPKIGQPGKRPGNRFVIARVRKERLQHFPSGVVQEHHNWV